MTATTTYAREPRFTLILRACLASPRCYWVLLALYLVGHVLLRLWASPNLGENDVQEAVAAQSWQWGYFPRNPPLFTWLLMGTYQVLGVSVLAHAVLKYSLLGALYTFAYLSGRRLLSTPTLAALSAWSLTLLSSLGWTIHTAFTHTLMLMVLIFAMLWAALRLVERRRLLNYVVFGACVGLGFLAKYSFFLFLIPLLVAMATQRQLRSALIDWRMLVALCVGAALFAPHGIWMATARFDFVTFLAQVQHVDADHSYAGDLALGFEDLALEALIFLSPFILIFAAFFCTEARKTGAPMTPWARATALIPLVSVSVLALEIFIVRATHFELRYLACALLVLPLVLFQWLDRRERSERRLHLYSVSVFAAGFIVFGGIAGRALFDVRECHRCVEEMPFASLYAAVRNAGFDGGTIITSDADAGGNMRLGFPEARVISAGYFIHQPPRGANGQCLIVWNARRQGDSLPEQVSAYLRHIGATAPEGGPTYVDALMRHSAERMDRFGYWLLPGYDSDCQRR